MKFTTKRYFKQAFLPNERCRKARGRDLPIDVEFDVKELTEDEFPLAFITSTYEYVADSYESESEFRIYDSEIRAYNGKLFNAALSQYGAKICGFEEPRTFFEHSMRVPTPYGTDNQSEFSESESVIIGDNKQDVIQAVQDYVDNKYYIFDNKVWVECSEPIYVAHFGFEQGSTGLYVQHRSPCSGKGFNALNRQQAIRYIKDKRPDFCEGNYPEKIKVFMPEMVKFQNVNLLPKGAHYCPYCGNTKKFVTVAHIAQDWVVDGNGEFIEVYTDCTETLAGPNPDNVWTCYRCGKEAVVKE